MESLVEENNCHGGKLKKYKVEAFIIPSIVIETVNDDADVNCTEESSINEIDDVKIANRSKVEEKECQEEEDETSTKGKSNEMRIITKVLAIKNVTSVQAASSDQEILQEGISENSNDIRSELHNENLTDANTGLKSNAAEFEEIYEEIDEPIYAVPYVEKTKNSREPMDTLFKRSDFWSRNYRSISKSFDNLQIPKPPKRTSSLKSIDERGEILEENYREFCYHAMKNGCTVAIQSPQEVSEEVFKENWLQRLESLRQREAFLRDKEVALQDRERLLFKKEKELRILERLVKEKVQKADLYLKRSRYLQSVESLPNSESERNLESRSSDDSKEFIRRIVQDVVSEKNYHDTQVSRVPLPGEYDIAPRCGKPENQLAEKCSRAIKAQFERKISQNSSDDKRNVESRVSSSSTDSRSSKNSRGNGNCKLSRVSSTENNDSAQKLCHSKMFERFDKCKMIQQSGTKISTSSIGTEINGLEARVLKNPPNSKSSLTTNNTNSIDINFHGNNGTHENPISRFSAYSSFKSRPRPKISYDDLDSTLSADIGDASFAITSKKFDPEIFKRPYEFTRSASERYVKNDRRKGISNFPNFCVAERRPYVDIEEEKVLKKVSENILVSQNEDTKFQNYGLIDKNVNTDNLKSEQTKKTDNRGTNDKKYSYLNLETGDKASRCKNERSTRDRPISWNAEASEWLQKKRQAYNMATKRMATEDFENKENFGSSVKIEKPNKSLKKREGKGRKFTIFR